MPARRIISPRNPRLIEFRKLSSARKYRLGLGKLALEGPNLVLSALERGFVPEAIILSDDYDRKELAFIEKKAPDAEIYLVPPGLFKSLSDTETPQGIAAIIPYNLKKPEEISAFPSGTASLLLDRISDPGNMGTIIRTAASAGAETVYYTSGSADPYSPKVLRATAGAIFSVQLVPVSKPLKLVETLKEAGIVVADTGPDAKLSYWDAHFGRTPLFIIGNESFGTAPELKAAATVTLSIPQAEDGAGSLNAAVAAALLLYEAYRRLAT